MQLKIAKLEISRLSSTQAVRLAAVLAAWAVLTLPFVLTSHARQASKAASQASTAGTVQTARGAAATCPLQGWAEGLSKNFLTPQAQFPTQDTPPTATDCNFQQWSWEAFAWAMAPTGTGGAPRFLSLPTEDDLRSKSADAKTVHARPLKLGVRAPHKRGTTASTSGEVAGAIVQADGNMMVGPGGYPVYASVHMNPSYFSTAQANLITMSGGQYQYASAPYFSVGDAVFKATWIRVVGNAPAGSYTTQAQVPNLTSSGGAIMPNGTFTTTTVALVGLHVVGYTINHKEFLWGTFEHNLNTPSTPDFTFNTSGTSSSSSTFYPAKTPFSKVNVCAVPGSAGSGCQGGLTLTGQTLAPLTYAVQENATGGNTQPNGPADIQGVNVQAQQALKSTFANYHLIGTVWLPPNTYSVNSTVANSAGSVNLTNTTAETFQQLAAKPSTPSNNCFACHNPQANNYQACGYNALGNNIIGVSHVIAVGTPWAVQNQIPASSDCAAGLLKRPGTKK